MGTYRVGMASGGGYRVWPGFLWGVWRSVGQYRHGGAPTGGSPIGLGTHV